MLTTANNRQAAGKRQAEAATFAAPSTGWSKHTHTHTLEQAGEGWATGSAGGQAGPARRLMNKK